MPVGHLERILRDGDWLTVSRGRHDDLGVRIARDGAHVAAFGAVSGPFTPSVLIENDPRVYEEEL